MENFKKIENTSLEEHENKLEKQRNIFLLSYVESLNKKKIPPFEDSFIDVKNTNNNEAIEEEIKINVNDLDMLLGRYTEIITELVVLHKKLEEKSYNIKWTDEEYKDISNLYLNKIKNWYINDNKNWMKNTISLVEEMDKKFNSLNIKEDVHNDIDKERAGIISFDSDTGEKLKDLFKNTDFNFDKNDHFLQLHLRPLFTLQYNKTNENIFSDNSLKKLAMNIVDRYPETKGIVGQSWILDTSIAQRVGFKILKREYIVSHSFFGQFQDANGQLVQDRINQLMETGEPPFKVATGVIDTIDFLKKYLPQERKGEITLKERNPDFDFEDFYHGKIRTFFNNWDSVSVKDIEVFLNQNEYLKMFLNTKEGSSLSNFLIQSKANDLKMKDLLKSDDYLKQVESFNKFINEKMFISKKVFIE